MERENKQPPKSTEEQVDELTKQLEEGVKNIYQSGEYEKFLQMISRLPQHSFRNNLLIYLQKPEATFVAGFKKWQEFDRHVKKGEKGIRIFAPMTYKKEVDQDGQNKSGQDTEKQTASKTSKKTASKKATSKAAASKTTTERKTEEIQATPKEVTIVGFKPVYVFDISQTDGEPLLMQPHRLEANVDNFHRIIEALRKVSPYPIGFEKMVGQVNGYCDSKAQRIAINDTLSQAHSVKTAIHEIAHARIHVDHLQDASREAKEIEAESVAYVVTNYYGIDSSDYSFSYVAGWAADQQLVQLQDSMKTIKDEASQLIADLDQALKELGLDLSQSQEQQPEQNKPKEIQQATETNETKETNEAKEPRKTTKRSTIKEQLEQAKEQMKEQQPAQRERTNQLQEFSL